MNNDCPLSPNHFDVVGHVAESVELALLFCSVCTCAMFGFLVYKTKMFNRNPKILVLNLIVSTLGIAITRTPMLIYSLMINEPASEVLQGPLATIHNCCIDLNMFTQVELAIECTILSFCHKWEKDKTYGHPLTVGTLIFPYILVGITVIVDSSRILGTMTRFFIFQSFNIGSSVLLIAMVCVNYSKYQDEYYAGHIQLKYQISVNVRTIRSLSVLAALSAMQNFTIAAILLPIHYYADPACDYQTMNYLSYAFDLTVALYCATYPFPVIFSNTEITKHFRYYILGRRHSADLKASMKIGDPHFNAKNVLGQRLYIDYQGQTEYFQNLMDTWKRKVNKY
ncbi:hypothetical protein Ddc_11709 [Ditylenchus destructor]|nr:hypothetical protein Ddc_11709 [Ditylenchus destructor]